MSNPRHRALQLRVPAQSSIPDWGWGWGQLVVVEAGAARVETPRTRALLTGGHALWMPAGTQPTVRPLHPLSLTLLYLDVELPDGMVVVGLSPLARALIRRLGTNEPQQGPRVDRQLAVLLDELVSSPAGGCPLPWPSTPSTRALAALLYDDTGAVDSLAHQCDAVGLSLRTAERRFRAETGWSLGRWRRLARLQRAAEQLEAGASVQRVARAVGYSSASAFVAAFKQAWGETPGAFRRAQRTGR